MFDKKEYELIDFGNGRKLERFGPLVLDRYCPAAEGTKSSPEIWTCADARFVIDQSMTNDELGRRGHWLPLTEKGQAYFPLSANSREAAQKAFPSWTIRHRNADFVLELKGSPFGHLGVFPEQSSNWDYIDSFARRFKIKFNRSAKILNLFAYTGGSTLAAAAGGSEPVHVDSAGNIVRQARSNADLSFQEDPKPIRWIVEDAVKFVRRELKRGSRYDGIILDPPAYGHGAAGQVWRLNRDLPKLLTDLAQIFSDQNAFLLLTCHTDPICLRKISEWLRQYFPNGSLHSEPIVLRSSFNKNLPAGHKYLLNT